MYAFRRTYHTTSWGSGMNMWIGWAWRISHLKNMKQLISTKWHECVDEILHRLHQPIGNINCLHLSFHQMQRFNCMSTQIEWKNPLKTRAIQPINQLVDALRSVSDICSNLKTNWRQFSFHYCNTIPAIDQSLHLPSTSNDRIKLQSNFNLFNATRIECNFQHCPLSKLNLRSWTRHFILALRVHCVYVAKWIYVLSSIDRVKPIETNKHFLI